MQILTKGRMFRTLHVWFESHADLKGLTGADTVILHDNPDSLPESGCLQCTVFHSLHSDIADYAAWKAGVSKKTLYEIRRAEKAETQVQIYTSAQVLSTPDLLDEFGTVYAEMYRQKGMDHSLPVRELQDYARADALFITRAVINGASVFHSYAADQQHVRLLHSCSGFRSGDQELRNALGRANRYLHDRDIAFFQQHGITLYDWGGISNPEAPNGIDRFKMEFGGNPVTYYRVVYRRSLAAKAVFSIIHP